MDLSKESKGFVSFGVGCSFWEEKLVPLVCHSPLPVWSVWLERNSKIFNDKVESSDVIWEKIKFMVASWMTKMQEFNHISITDAVGDWNLLCL